MESLKCVFVGDGAVGKSCLLISLTTNAFPSEYVPTCFDNFVANVMHEGRPVNITYWDTAGQEDYDRLRPLSYPNSDVFAVGFSNRQSFENIRAKWVPEIQHFLPGVPMVLVGMKSDLRTYTASAADMVSGEEARALAAELGMSAYLETSALTQDNLPELQSQLIRIGLEKKAAYSVSRRERRWRSKFGGLFGFRGGSGGSSAVATGSLSPAKAGPPALPPAPKAPNMEMMGTQLGADWQSLLGNMSGGQGDGTPSRASDLTLMVDGESFPVHSAILGAAVPALRPVLSVEKTMAEDFNTSSGFSPNSSPKSSLNSSPNSTASLSVASAVADAFSMDKGAGKLTVASTITTKSAVSSTSVSATTTAITARTFGQLLCFVYGGDPQLPTSPSADEVTALRDLARAMGLDELVSWCDNLGAGQVEDGFAMSNLLNPSIATFVADRSGREAGRLFLDRHQENGLADVEFEVRGRHFLAHRAFLCSRSPVFSTMLCGGFAEGTAAGAGGGLVQVQVEDCSAESFRCLLEYIYTDHTDVESADMCELLAMASRYEVPRLVGLCELHLSIAIAEQTKDTIIDAEVDILDLLKWAEEMEATRLVLFLRHFVCTNYGPLMSRYGQEGFDALSDELKEHIALHQYPPVSYLEAVAAYAAEAETEKQETAAVAKAARPDTSSRFGGLQGGFQALFTRRAVSAT